MDEEDKRHHISAGLRPIEWDTRPASLASEIRGFLKTVRDEGTPIDSGGGDRYADLWVTVQGVEYHITVSKSRKQVISEGKETNAI